MLQSLIPEHFFNQYYQYHLQVVRWIYQNVGVKRTQLGSLLGREFETSRVWLFRQVFHSFPHLTGVLCLSNHILFHHDGFAIVKMYNPTLTSHALHIFMGLMGHLCLKENSIRGSSWHHGSVIPMFHLPSLRSMHEVTVRWLRLKQDSEWRPMKQQGKIWKTITHWVPLEWFFMIFNDSWCIYQWNRKDSNGMMKAYFFFPVPLFPWKSLWMKTWWLNALIATHVGSVCLDG